jgi:hypothetical protein
MDDTTFLATWDDAGKVGVVNLTKAELIEFTDKGKHITSMLKIHRSHLYCAYCQKSDEKY